MVSVALITNQSGIARGFFRLSHVDSVNQRMQELLSVEALLAAIYANGLLSECFSASSRRKLSPQMLLEAARLFIFFCNDHSLSAIV